MLQETNASELQKLSRTKVGENQGPKGRKTARQCVPQVPEAAKQQRLQGPMLHYTKSDKNRGRKGWKTAGQWVPQGPKAPEQQWPQGRRLSRCGGQCLAAGLQRLKPAEQRVPQWPKASEKPDP